jgi:hypothetical protein
MKSHREDVEGMWDGWQLVRVFMTYPMLAVL